MTTLIERYERITGGFRDRLAGVAADAWHQPTPCSDWDVRQLVAHVLDEQLWIPPLLAGETVAGVGDRFGGDQLGADATQAWDSAVTLAREAAVAPGALSRTVHLSFGDDLAENYLWQVTADTLIHTWDLARATGADEDLGADDVAAVADFLMPQAEAWRAAGAFGPAAQVSADPDQQTRLLAATGRA